VCDLETSRRGAPYIYIYIYMTLVTYGLTDNLDIGQTD